MGRGYIKNANVPATPKTQAEWNAYDRMVDAGKAPPRRSGKGMDMTTVYLKQSLKRNPNGKGWIIERDSSTKTYKTKADALDWLKD